jgi:hypothetical protein
MLHVLDGLALLLGAPYLVVIEKPWFQTEVTTPRIATAAAIPSVIVCFLPDIVKL